MEIKILTVENISEAAGLSRNVFDYCLRNTISDGQMIQAFETYAEPGELKRMVEENKLIMWGAYEQNMLVGMSAMQPEGHITMLYVLPMYQRHGIGKRLVYEMRKYAKSTYNLTSVTVNAMPAWTANYFSRRKFRPMNSEPVMNASFVSMQAPSIEEVEYDKKPLSTAAILSTVLGSLVLCVLIVIIGVIRMLG